MTEEVTRKVSDKQERDNVDEVDNCLADDVLVRLVRRKKKKTWKKEKEVQDKMEPNFISHGGLQVEEHYPRQNL